MLIPCDDNPVSNFVFFLAMGIKDTFFFWLVKEKHQQQNSFVYYSPYSGISPLALSIFRFWFF